MASLEHGIQLELFPTRKRCCVCDVVKPLTEFHRKSAARDGLQSQCRACNIEAAKEFHADNVEHCRARIKAWMRKVDLENKRRVFEYLVAHPCVDCGERDPVVLEFDHLRDKVAGVAQLLHAHVKWPIVEAEIAKCEVRCANCHRRRTAIGNRWFRTLQDPWAARGSNPDLTD